MTSFIFGFLSFVLLTWTSVSILTLFYGKVTGDEHGYMDDQRGFDDGFTIIFPTVFAILSIFLLVLFIICLHQSHIIHYFFKLFYGQSSSTHNFGVVLLSIVIVILAFLTNKTTDAMIFFAKFGMKSPFFGKLFTILILIIFCPLPIILSGSSIGIAAIVYFPEHITNYEFVETSVKIVNLFLGEWF